MSIGRVETLFTRERQSFEIWTDHKNLEYFMSARKLNCQHASWSLELAEYNFTLKYCPGQLNKKANFEMKRSSRMCENTVLSIATYSESLS